MNHDGHSSHKGRNKIYYPTKLASWPKIKHGTFRMYKCTNQGTAKCHVFVIEVEVEVTLRLTVSQYVCIGIEHPCGTCEQILLPVGMFLSEICGLISLTRRRVCCSVMTQQTESCRTRIHTLLSHLRLPQHGGPGSRIYIPQEEGGPVTLPATRLFV
jgi:hypothetical protein